jgi:hypothetical protein
MKKPGETSETRGKTKGKSRKIIGRRLIHDITCCDTDP